MSIDNIPEEAPTKRVGTPQDSPLEAKTRRVDANRVGGTSTNQEDVATPSVGVAANHIASERSGPLGALEPGTILCGDCVVVRTHRNHESERPGLFECQAPEGHVMVKVAADDLPPNPELWEKLSTLNHANVLRIFRTHVEGGYFFEVQEFCSEGTLADYVPAAGSGRPTPPIDWVERALVPFFHAGISYLHSQGIVHRDIKPANLYLREVDGRKCLVVGDFDISSVLQTGRTSRATQRAAGTWIYSAPEAFPRFMDEKASKLGSAVVRSSDYYSFGVVIVELLLGTTSLHQAQLPDLYDFYLQGGRVEVPQGLPPRISELLSGLLCRNRQRRWGDEEVARWLANATTDDDRRRIAEDNGYRLGRSVAAFNAFEEIKPANLADLSQAIVQEPWIALDELMSGDVMLNWIGQLDARIARLIRQDREKWREHPRLALLCARLHLDPLASLSFGQGRHVGTAEEWAKSAIASGASAEKLCDKEALLELEIWLKLKAMPEPEAAASVAKIVAWHDQPLLGDEDNSVDEPATEPVNYLLILEELCWAFLPKKPFVVAPGLIAQTPQQIVEFALGEPWEWTDRPPARYISAVKRWKEGYLEAYLRQRLMSSTEADSPLLGQMQTVRKQFSDKPFVAFEMILRLLNPELPSLEIELSKKGFHEVLQILYGGQATREIAYRTKGMGMPFAALRLQCQGSGLVLENHEIAHRRGHIKMRLHSQGDIPVGREFRGTIFLAGGFTKLAEGDATIRYRITYPVKDTVKKVAVGAIIGALLLGTARGGMMALVPRAMTPADALLLSHRTWIILFGGLGITVFLALRIWFWALAKHAR